MDILGIENVDLIDKVKLFDKDSNNREINIYYFTDVLITGESISYPNTLLYDLSNNLLINPVNEKTMSLTGLNQTEKYTPKTKEFKKVEENTVFFYIYNFENYYHFVYDSLPYLISYLEYKKTNNKLKILMSYPQGKTDFYRFVIEFLQLIGIDNSDIIIADSETLYKNMLVSTSYTQGINPNLPPREEIYDFYKMLVKKVNPELFVTPKNIYVSRRTWLHGDVSNIGTNYTTRRKLVNEDKLVNYLTKKGYTEIFTENLTTVEKIILFSNAENIVGSIGGGVCNVLFSTPKCNLTTLVSPHFLDINKRFIYSFKNVNTLYFTESENTEKNYFKNFMRVKCDDLVGEIIRVFKDTIKISYSDIKVSGWNSEYNYKTITKKKCECDKLDDGLNSSWKINLKKLKEIL